MVTFFSQQEQNETSSFPRIFLSIRHYRRFPAAAKAPAESSFFNEEGHDHFILSRKREKNPASAFARRLRWRRRVPFPAFLRPLPDPTQPGKRALRAAQNSKTGAHLSTFGFTIVPAQYSTQNFA